ncbi:MAG: ATP-binding protein [Planctomycetota bacterium]|nr:ATP-binding protein [Planctomycetota bacterium]
MSHPFFEGLEYLRRFEELSQPQPSPAAPSEPPEPTIEKKYINLQNLLELCKVMNSTIEMDVLLKFVMDRVIEFTQAERGFLVLVSEEGEMDFKVALTRKQEPIRAPAAQVSHSILSKVVSEGKTIACEDAIGESGFAAESSIMELNLRSILCVPLLSREKMVGAIYVDNRYIPNLFSDRDVQFLETFANQAAVAIDNALLYKQLSDSKSEIEKWNQDLESRVEARTTELKQLQQQLVESDKMAAVGLLAAGIAHEFNNILAVIMGFAELAEKNDEFKDRLPETVVTQAKRARDITTNLLSFSRVRDDKLEKSNVVTLVDSVLSIVEKELRLSGIDIEKRFDSVPSILMSPGQLQQVFLNLILNASHAIDGHGTIRIEVTSDKYNIYTTVSDTGRGIPKEHLSRIFEPFFTTKGSFGGGERPGTGLGLTVSYNVVRQHDGRIQVDSHIGRGSTFTVILPIHRRKKAAQQPQESKTGKNHSLTGLKKVLLVDDEEGIRDLILQVLEKKGLMVRTSGTAVEAMEILEKEKIDCLLLDIKLPGKLSGYDVLKVARKGNRSIKVVIMTGKQEDATLRRAIRRADGYLRKPFTLSEIARLFDGSGEGSGDGQELTAPAEQADSRSDPA